MTDQGRPRREPSSSIRRDEIENPDVVGHDGAAAAPPPVTAADAASGVGVGDKGSAKTIGKGKAAGWGGDGGRRTDEEDTFRVRRSFSSGDFSGVGSRGSGRGGGWKSWGGGWRSVTDDSSEDSVHSSPPSPASFSPAAWLSPRPAGSGKGTIEDSGHPGPFWGGGSRPSRIESEDSLGTNRRSGGRAAKGRGGGTALGVASGNGELHSVEEADATREIEVTAAGGDVSNEARDSPSSRGSSSSVEGGPLMKFFASVSGGGAWASDVGGKSGVSQKNAVMSREGKVSGEPDLSLSVPAIRKKKVTRNHAVSFHFFGGGVRDGKKSEENYDYFFNDIQMNLLYLTIIHIFLCMHFKRNVRYAEGFFLFWVAFLCFPLNILCVVAALIVAVHRRYTSLMSRSCMEACFCLFAPSRFYVGGCEAGVNIVNSSGERVPASSKL